MLPNLLRRSRVATLAPFAALAALAACDIPSEAPIFQQTWIVPSDSVSVGAQDLVPAGVTLSGGATPTFVFTTPSANINSTLGQVCGQPACQSAVTVTAPTPAFSTPDDLLVATVAFPAGVSAATVTGGSFNVAITNNLGFDPLRPNGAVAPFGTLTITITSGALTATQTFNGATRTMPNGATTPLVVTLPTGAYAGSVRIELALDVPAGDPATMNSNNGLAIAASIQGLAVSQATIAVVNETVDTDPTEFDFEDVDFAEEVESGALLLTTTNPFTATAALNVVIEAPAQDGEPALSISKPVAIPATPTSTATVNLTQGEMRSLLGKSSVTIRVTGNVNGTGPGSTIVVTPAAQITVRTQLQLILNIGA